MEVRRSMCFAVPVVSPQEPFLVGDIYYKGEYVIGMPLWLSYMGNPYNNMDSSYNDGSNSLETPYTDA